MTVYFVTGKLGAGKSLMSVSRIREALERSAPVATNLDINLAMMLGRNKRNTRLLRIPDKPTIQDLRAIGIGNKTYDEKKNGLIVLDECGTWFNSRTWNDKSRQEVINWMLHARKLGWDVIFIVQDISIVDKQARLALGEHVVFCRRLDRMKIPIIGTWVSFLTLGQISLKLPKFHIGIVKYGDNANSLTVDKWPLYGTDLYAAYDTKQAFSDHYPHRVYSVLPPYYTHGRYSVPMTLRNIMRITKIYARKYSRVFAFMAGIALAFGVNRLTQESPVTLHTNHSTVQVETINVHELLEGYTIARFSNFPNAPVSFELRNKGDALSSLQLADLGLSFTVVNRCNITINQGDSYETVYC